MSATDSADETKKVALNPSLPKKRRRPNRQGWFLDVSTKEMIVNLYLSAIKENPSVQIEPLERKVASQTGVSRITVYRVVREYKNTSEISGPKVRKDRKSIFELLNDFSKNCIRRKVHQFYLRNDLPTSEKILKQVNDETDLPNFRRATFYKLLNKLNFRIHRHRQSNMLMDTNEVAAWRRDYIRKIRSYRKENRKIYYLDETWMYSGNPKFDSSFNSVPSSWKPFFAGLQKSADRGKRHIFCIIGSEDGFVPDTFWSLVTNESGHCHEKTDVESFEQWFLNVLPKLEDNSVIVLDNALYHCRYLENFPTTNWSKTEIQNWLRLKNINFTESMLKAELLAIITECKEKNNKYYIDEIAGNQNKTILRLPPYHCDLSPIESVWTDLKNYVAENNSAVKFNFVDIPKMFHEAVTNFPAEKWRSYIQHIQEKTEQEMWNLDNILESYLEPVTLDDRDESSSSE